MHSHDALHNNPPPSITINNIINFQADDEKVARNRQKQEDAIRSLKEETDALMDSLRANNAQRQRLMTERCSWLRSSLCRSLCSLKPFTKNNVIHIPNF